MKTTDRQSSGQFWIWGFIFLFLLHAFAILWFADRRETQPVWEKPAAFLYLSSGPNMDRQIIELTGIHDPTLFALPHPNAFSGVAWLNFRPHVATLNDTSAPPEWLALSPDQLGGVLGEFVATNRPSEEQLLASLRTSKPAEVRIPGDPIMTNTAIRIEGLLTTRKLIYVPPLPNAVSNDVLRATSVTISVNGDGLVESASVGSESGSRAADAHAVGTARLLEFEPVPVSDALQRLVAPPMIGRVTFTWHIVTNANLITASAP